MSTYIHPDTHTYMGFPNSSTGKESACNAGDLGSIPGLRRSPGEGNSYPLHYTGLENSIDSVVHGVAKSRTQLSDFHFIYNLLALREAHFPPPPRHPLFYPPKGLCH